MEEHRLSGLEAKVVRLEEVVDTLRDLNRELRKENDELYAQTQKLNTSIALLDQSVKELVNKGRDRKAVSERVFMFIVGGFIAAAVSWIVKGGLGT